MKVRDSIQFRGDARWKNPALSFAATQVYSRFRHNPRAADLQLHMFWQYHMVEQHLLHEDSGGRRARQLGLKPDLTSGYTTEITES